jgi:hypothetical protein
MDWIEWGCDIEKSAAAASIRTLSSRTTHTAEKAGLCISFFNLGWF